MLTDFYVALGAVVGLGFIGLAVVWFGVPLAKKHAQKRTPQMELDIPPKPRASEPARPRPIAGAGTR